MRWNMACCREQARDYSVSIEKPALDLLKFPKITATRNNRKDFTPEMCANTAISRLTPL